MAKTETSPAPVGPAAKADANTSREWKGAFDAFGQIFDQIKKNPEPAIVFVVSYVLATALSVAANGGKPVNDFDGKSYAWVVQLVFLLGLPLYGLALADRKTFTISEFFAFDLKKFVFLIAGSILFGLIIGFSFLLFIVPIVWTLAWFCLFEYPIAEKGMGPVEALTESKRLCQNNKAKVWGVIGASLLFVLLAAAVSFIPVIGSAATAFMSVLSTGVMALLYRHLQSTVVSSHK